MSNGFSSFQKDLPKDLTNITVVELFGTKARLKIIHTLSMEPNYELNISDITRKTQQNHKRVSNEISFLKKIGIIQEKKYGRIRILRLKEERYKVKFLIDFLESWESQRQSK
ncbi:MAG: hypothetical protein GF317_01670 [Candidatus Lokiarchaeota archaeon]|nr:hypothetical protein [Candidatus Lokiarchaeota archaeon]